MDLRRRIKYKLARISEEDEEEKDEEEPDEETSMMDDKTFTDGEGSDTDMADPSPDLVTEPTAEGADEDGSSSPPQSNGITNSHGPPETGLSVTVVDSENHRRSADGDDDVGEIRLPLSTHPPSYKDPPSYDDCVRLSVLNVSKEKQREDDDEDLELDQDQSVEPNIMVNPMDAEMDGEDEVIEMSEMKGQVSTSPGIVETSYIVPSTRSFGDERYSLPPPQSDQREWELPEIESQTHNPSSWLNIFSNSLSEANSRHLLILVFSVLIAVVAVLIIVLLPLSFSYLEYYELGLKEQRSTGRIYFDEDAFESGRYAIGPDFTFKKYPSWARNVQLDKIDVTTTSRLALSFSCSFQYFIREGELGLLEQRFDQGYDNIIQSVAQAAIKNIASLTSLTMYLERRRDVEIVFHETLRTKLGGNCCPDRERCLLENTCHLCSNSTVDCNQGYHVDVPFFQLLTINLPDIIVNNNLQVQVMYEQAEMEMFIQTEMLTRKDIEKKTESITNLASEVLNNGTATANLIRSFGEAQARAKIEAANSKGLALMYNRMGVVTDQHKASLHWLRTLGKHERLVLGLSFERYLELMKDYTVR